MMLLSNHFRFNIPGALLSLLLIVSTPPTAMAEEIHIPIGQQADDESAIQMPTKGMTKERVKAAFGEPLEASEPKGNPPISRWVYSDFVVYFEHDHVIHNVRAFKPKATPAPTE